VILARVVGTVVAPVKHAVFEGQKLLLVRGESPRGEATGPNLVAVDRAQAGIGDRVLVLHEGSSARDLVGRGDAPVRAAVVAVVDDVELHGG